MAYTKSKSQVNIRDRLSQWDSRLAPLSDHQKDGFMQLSSSASFRPIPSHVSNCSRFDAHDAHIIIIARIKV